MAKLITSIFLAILLVDLASSVSPASRHDGPGIPQGMRRMIETLQNKEVGDYQCALEACGRSLSVKQRGRA